MEQLIQKTREHVFEFMKSYDPSHDYSHLLRVVGLAHAIEASQREKYPDLVLDTDIITLSAFLHDVGDRKYIQPGQNGETLVRDTLCELGAAPELADKVQKICTNVAYSSETKSDATRIEVARLCKEIPELGIVQDADRLDSIGATGIARYFAFSGARREVRGLCTDHFYDKLLKIVDLMKTDMGKKLAEERTERLKIFLGWWKIECDGVEGLPEEMERQHKAEREKWDPEAREKKEGKGASGLGDCLIK